MLCATAAAQTSSIAAATADPRRQCRVGRRETTPVRTVRSSRCGRMPAARGCRPTLSPVALPVTSCAGAVTGVGVERWRLGDGSLELTGDVAAGESEMTRRVRSISVKQPSRRHPGRSAPHAAAPLPRSRAPQVQPSSVWLTGASSYDPFDDSQMDLGGNPFGPFPREAGSSPTRSDAEVIGGACFAPRRERDRRVQARRAGARPPTRRAQRRFGWRR
jgi:hypothetical protein